MGALRTAARPVSQYGGNGRKIKVLLDFFQKIAVSKGSAFGRPPQRAKFPLAAASEIPRRPKPPSADGGIPANGQGPPASPKTGGSRGAFCAQKIYCNVGVSRLARRDRGAAPGPCDFLKKIE